MISKEKWVSIMRSCGFSEDQMHRWHAEFERSAPEEHQEFLEFLHIPAAEIKTIRNQSRAGL
jgi:MerR family transcriptional regulator, thiopeptide resistance regulator